MSTATHLRAALTERLAEDGALTDPEWRDAAGAVPRELFARSYFRPVAGSVPTGYRPVRAGEPGWLEGIYSDETLITQLDGRIRPDDVAEGTVTGSPSSSSTLPSLVLGMWQQLGAEAGHRVLEIGTGTGYSTALGAHRLGDSGLTSIEYDAAVGGAAAAALKAAGFAPRLIIGDGLRGDPDGGRYDRLIATCSVRYIPPPWLHQVKPGGKILVTLSGWSYASALALLDVTGPGEATGRFLPGFTSFMIARTHDRPPRPALALLPGEERPEPDRPREARHVDRWLGRAAGGARRRTPGGGCGTDPLGRAHRLPGTDGSRPRRRVDRRPAWTRTPVGPGRTGGAALAGRR